MRLFDLIRATELPPGYNIAPTQPVAAIRSTDEGRMAAHGSRGVRAVAEARGPEDCPTEIVASWSVHSASVDPTM